MGLAQQGVWVVLNVLVVIAGFWIGTLTLSPYQAQSQGQNPVEAYKEQVVGELQAAVRASVDGYFEASELPKPAEIRVQGRPDIVRVSGGGLALRSAVVDVILISDYPSTVLREVRMQLARDLVAQGYRLQETDADRAGGGTLRPLLELNFAGELPTEATTPWQTQLKHALVLACMVLAAISGMVLAFILLWQPFRRQRQVQKRQRQQGGFGEAVHGSSTDFTTPAIQQEPSVGLQFAVSAIPHVDTGNKSDDLASQLQANRGETALHVPHSPRMPGSNTADVAASQEALKQLGVPAGRLHETFARLPFERALTLLAALEPKTRAVVIEQLRLNSSVRRRIEAALAEMARV